MTFYLKQGVEALIKVVDQLRGWFNNLREMLISIQVVVEVDVVLGNRCSLVAWFTTFSAWWWVGGCLKYRIEQGGRYSLIEYF